MIRLRFGETVVMFNLGIGKETTPSLWQYYPHNLILSLFLCKNIYRKKGNEVWAPLLTVNLRISDMIPYRRHRQFSQENECQPDATGDVILKG